MNIGRAAVWATVVQTGDAGISNTQILPARTAETGSVWVAVILLPLFLVAPALWNGYPLLQWDTGGYLARWYEGYLVPSRSSVFGLYLHIGEGSSFWLNLGLQALATLWILHLTLRVLSLGQPLRLLWIGLLLILTTALPWLASMLLTDIFAGLAVLGLFILVTQRDRITALERCALFAFVAFASATHSATLGVLFGLCCAGVIAQRFFPDRIALAGLMQGSATIVAGAAMLLGANYALAGQLAWTPGGVGVAFGRMLQDGIVTKYLNDHCPQLELKLCPYRNALPPTADDFLWGNSMFNSLGRFEGMNDEMAYIVTHSLRDYPLWQAKAAVNATLDQLLHVATGEGTNGWLPHTYGIIDRYIPSQSKPMHAAHQQHWDISFAPVNWLHVPVAFGSMLAMIGLVGHAIWRRRRDDVALLAATVTIALLGNAVICGVISGPHDRYGARLVWIATFTALVAAARYFGGAERNYARRDRNSITPAL